ncbi:hypothetical protein CLV46_1738 [Diaminobutyricimonas aerilata]|uniref:FAR-17a/AIG1-like protein n=1 Tax=Diaminobutyricimonas aerilata TaxID=1162967 RepID=A0A2M9CJU9_9MICO|nr:Pr6Pr family membrane protein [Diaminobutyricimonas aerilata]PJJ72173.1 hypothetical protein CLV46_1738 [Diaminobutyricimonas aerilata]
MIPARHHRVVAVLRLVVAVVGVVALVGRFFYGLGFSTFATGNYFGYLTMQSNIAGVALMVTGAVSAWRRPVDATWFSTARLLVTSYLGVAGIVFALLATQAGNVDYRLEVPWSDQLLHFWIPGYAVLDWLFAPGRRRVSWRMSALVLGYPVVWGMATMLRGSIVGWYPYFFLDPGQLDNLGEFAGYAIAALALFSGVAAALIGLSRLIPTRV